MYEPHVERILAAVRPDEVVLDVGGWACPFNRANYVLDAGSYETRGAYARWGGVASQGGTDEWFRADTWIQRDICERTPWPFESKSIDFAICSHTLEDLRDPLWVCSELNRVAKRGYIEVPSRAAESSRGWEHRQTAGLSHHRWLIDIHGAHLRFVMKYHMIHRWRYSLPRSHLRSLTAEKQIASLFWADRFTFSEAILHGADIPAELDAFIARTRPYPAIALRFDAMVDETRSRVTRLGRYLGRRLR